MKQQKRRYDNHSVFLNQAVIMYIAVFSASVALQVTHALLPSQNAQVQPPSTKRPATSGRGAVRGQQPSISASKGGRGRGNVSATSRPMFRSSANTASSSSTPSYSSSSSSSSGQSAPPAGRRLSTPYTHAQTPPAQSHPTSSISSSSSRRLSFPLTHPNRAYFATPGPHHTQSQQPCVPTADPLPSACECSGCCAAPPCCTPPPPCCSACSSSCCSYSQFPYTHPQPSRSCSCCSAHHTCPCQYPYPYYPYHTPCCPPQPAPCCCQYCTDSQLQVSCFYGR